MAARTPARSLNLAKVGSYCDTKPGASRTRPFGPEPLVFKVAGKMFALLGHLDGQEIISLKCDPERSTVLRTSYPAIVPGYHLNKEHWNTSAITSKPATRDRLKTGHVGRSGTAVDYFELESLGKLVA